MFSSSTQLEHWTFTGTTELKRLRAEANHKYISQHGPHMDEATRQQYFLTPEEESVVYSHYEYVLHEFCSKFQPPMPRSVLGTSLMFFKRFYLHNSVMDYHPQNILYVCAYLACKVDEFNVSITQFVANQKSVEQDAMINMILTMELLLMQQLHYHLTVHNPFRPLEGLLIDIKTRCKTIENAEMLRQGADDFLDKSLHTDTALLFAPSQIATAAILTSGSKIGISLDNYVANHILGPGGKEKVLKTVEHIKRIRFMVKSLENPDRSRVRTLEQKLQQCRNQENNPFSEEYASKIEDMLDEDENDEHVRKKPRMEDPYAVEQDLLGI